MLNIIIEFCEICGVFSMLYIAFRQFYVYLVNIVKKIYIFMKMNKENVVHSNSANIR